MKITPVINFLPQINYKHQNKNAPANSYVKPQGLPEAQFFKANFLPSFTSVCRSDKNGVPINSGFYRDYNTLLFTKKYLEEQFPQGCDIVVGACSTGEDLISLYSLLDKREKYNYKGIDLSAHAIEMAKNNAYGISELCKDGFLLERSFDFKDIFLRKCFADVMCKGEKTDYPLNIFNGGEVTNAYFKVKPEHFKNLEFVNADMTKLDLENPAGVIFFRQGLYQVANNKLEKAIFGKKKFKPDNSDKRALLEPLVNSIHKNLKEDGLFVMGNIPAEHFYIADKKLKPNEKIMIGKLSVFDNAINDYMANSEVEIYRLSPLYQLLFEDDRFDVVYESKGDLAETKFYTPTVWRKIK